MEDTVECHSSYTYAEQPVAVYWQGQRREISEIGKSWKSPQGKHFNVRTNGDLEFELLYQQYDDVWLILPR